MKHGRHKNRVLCAELVSIPAALTYDGSGYMVASGGKGVEHNAQVKDARVSLGCRTEPQTFASSEPWGLGRIPCFAFTSSDCEVTPVYDDFRGEVGRDDVVEAICADTRELIEAENGSTVVDGRGKRLAGLLVPVALEGWVRVLLASPTGLS